MSTSGREAPRVAVAFLAVASLAVACAPPTPSMSATRRPAATQALASSSPTPVPTTAPLGAIWQRGTGIDDGDVVDIAHGPGGWVAVGASCLDDCQTLGAAAWFSTDGVAWAAVPIPGGSDASLVSVATDGTAWFAAGLTLEDTGNNVGASSARFWRSTNGRDWTLGESIFLGECFEGCPGMGQLAARPGSVLAAQVFHRDNDASSLLWSADGAAWESVPSSTFGVVPGERMSADLAIATSAGYIIIGSACATCLTTWASPDGRSGTVTVNHSSDPSGSAFQQGRDVATDGRTVVIIEEACDAPGDCVTHSRSSTDEGSSWTDGVTPIPFVPSWFPRVTFAGDSFIVAGRRTPNGIGVFVSRDGLAWTELRTNLSLGDCNLQAIAGSEDRVMVAGDSQCPGIWVSRVR